MRLYLNAISKNGLAYTPDTLIVENGNERHEYDIQGWTDFLPTMGLACRTKGELKRRDEQLDDYVDMTEEDEKKLLDLIANPSSSIIVSIYPIAQFEDKNEELDTDLLTECFGELILSQGSADFKFNTEFYGI